MDGNSIQLDGTSLVQTLKELKESQGRRETGSTSRLSWESFVSFRPSMLLLGMTFLLMFLSLQILLNLHFKAELQHLRERFDKSKANPIFFTDSDLQGKSHNVH